MIYTRVYHAFVAVSIKMFPFYPAQVLRCFVFHPRVMRSLLAITVAGSNKQTACACALVSVTCTFTKN